MRDSQAAVERWVNMTTAIPSGLEDAVDFGKGLLHQPPVVFLGDFFPPFAAAEAGGVDHGLLVFGRQRPPEGFGVEVAHGAPQPDVEEVGEVGVGDVVGVGRVNDDGVKVPVREGQGGGGAEMDGTSP
jgi:hypothetical protein